MKTYVTYLRVSTVRQGASGLGLEAQRAAVAGFVKGYDSIIAEYVEVESGKNNNRLQLTTAIAHAKKQGATLLIAKLDRLSRNAAFIFTLRDSGVDFVCVDIPDANPLTIGIFAVLAQNERETIAKRTKDALQAKKARGESLGTPANLTAVARAAGTAAIKANASNHKANVQARQIIDLLSAQNLTLAAMAERLNQTGYRTRHGCLFNAKAVLRLKAAKAAL